MKIDNRIFNEVKIVTKVDQDTALAVAKQELMQHMRCPQEPSESDVINHLKTITKLGYLSNKMQLYWWLLDLSKAKYNDKFRIVQRSRGGYLAPDGFYFIIRHDNYVDADLFIGNGDGVYTHEMLLELNRAPHTETYHRSNNLMATTITAKQGSISPRDNFLDLAEGVLASKFFRHEL